MLASQDSRVAHPVLLIVLGLIMGLGILFQLTTYANHDTITIIFSIQKWMHGGHYGSDFFTTLTPMSLILFYPPVKLATLFNLPPTILTNLYFAFFILLNLWITTKLLKQNYSPAICHTWSITYCILFFFYVRNDFLQRDTLCIILVLPYIISLVSHCHHNPSVKYDIISALFAGFGFALKPHFLIAWFCLELYFAFHQKTIRSFLRWQNWVTGSVILSYALSVQLFFDDYVSQILPYIVSNFYKIYFYQQAHPFNNYDFLTFCFSLMYLLLYRRYRADNSLITVLTVAAIGFFIEYLVQGKSWFYHEIPMMICILLAVMVSLVDFFVRPFNIDYTSSKNTLYLSLMTLCLYTALWITSWTVTANMTQMIQTNYTNNTHFSKLTKYLKQHSQNEFIGLINSDVRQGTVIMYYSGHKPAVRFDHLWLLSSLLMKGYHYQDLTHTNEIATRQFVIDAISEDLNTYQPSLLLVDAAKKKLYIHDNQFDYVKYLNHDPKFRAALNHYRFDRQIDQYHIYKRIS